MNMPREFHIDSYLSGLLIGYRPRNFIADQILPVVPVNKQSNVYAKILKDDWFRNEVADRAPGTLANEIGYKVSSDTYFCPNYEFRHGIPIETINNADQPHAPAQRGAEFIVDKLMLNYEIRTEDTITTGVGSTSTPTTWGDFNNSDPMTDIEVAQEAIRSTTGYVPNTAIIPRKVFLKLRRHPDIVQRVFPGAGIGGTVNVAQMADLFGVSKILVPETIKNTATEGAANAFTDVWSTHVSLLYVDPNPGLMTPTFGIAFRWNGDGMSAAGPGISIERKFDDDRKVQWLRGGYYQDEKIVAAELGFQIKTGITA
jgi:hypothetical protein